MAASHGSPWEYKPSPVAALLFLVFFIIATLWHVVIIVRRRVFFFIVLVLGGALEIIGYVTRYLAAKNTDNLTFFIIQTLCILVAPALIAASIYMVLGRIMVRTHAEEFSPIRPSRLTKVFVGGDVLTFIVQIMGSGMLSSNFNRGKVIILIGLAAQIIFFAIFVAIASVFHRRLARYPTEQSLRNDAASGKKGWRGVMLVIYVSSALIFVRSIFRFIEFVGDRDSVFQKSEAFLYICDSTLMLGVLAVLIYHHPSEYLPGRKDIDRAHDGEEMG